MEAAELTATRDPINTEIIRNHLLAGADEMMANLKRAAYGPHIYEVADCVTGLFDKTGNTLALAPGSPMMLVDLGAVVRDGLKKIGVEEMHPGDIIACNDPYALGTHSSNMALYSPVYWHDELVAFTATRAHWIDTGGSVPGGKSFKISEIWQEGFQFRHLKLYSRGEPVADMIRFIDDNVRVPTTVLGDMRAQIAACKTGERRYLTLLDKFGRAVVEGCVEEMFRQSEELTRQAVARMPDGEYHAQSFLDDDGVTLGKPVPIRVTVRIAGDSMTVDYSDMSDQVDGPINTGIASAQGIACFAFKAMTTPHDPPNEGHFRPLDVIVPPGKIVSAVSPAATCWWSKLTNTTIDTILAAIGQAIPGEVPAPHFGDMPLIMISGRDPRKSDRQFIFFQPLPGGYGGRAAEDGEGCTNCLHEGDMMNIPVEVEEHEFPVHTEYARFRADSEGPGEFRGGFGYESAYRLLTGGELFVGVERTKCPPWGVAGGGSAEPNTFTIQEGDAEPEVVLKGEYVRLSPETLCVVRTGGGGGYGDPLKRDAKMVADDVRLGYISADGARARYGVVVSVKGRLDGEATDVLRRQRAASS